MINAHRYRISFLFLFLLQSLHDYLCCRARHTHAPHLLQPTLPPLQSSICSKAIWSTISMSIYLLDCFSARLSRFLCQRHTFGQKWTCLYSIDSAAESTSLSISGRSFLPWYSNTSFHTHLHRFCQNFKPFWHYLASQQPLTGTFIRYLCTAHIEVFDNDSSPSMDYQPMYNWSIRRLPTLSAVICTITALDLDMWASNFTVRQDHANLLTTYLRRPIQAD